MKKYLLLLSFIGVSCSTPPSPTDNSESYRSCVNRHEAIRKKMFLEMPEKFRASFAGYHHIQRYYSSAPSVAQIKKDVQQIERENSTYDSRKDPQSKGFDPRFIDDTPGRNNILVSFERHRHYRFGKEQDVTLLRIDYSKPEVTYTCPLDLFKDNGTSLTCHLSGSISSSKQLEGSMLTFNYDFKLRLVPIDKKYFYFEWSSNGDKIEADQPADQLLLRALVSSTSEERFQKIEFPYLDPQGDLNPEECAVLEGT